MVNNGVLFISPENIKILGGKVDEMTTKEYLIAALEQTL
jgi:hypothetical protein